MPQVLASDAMVSLEDMRDFMNLTDGSKDNKLILLINSVTQEAKTYCNRVFKSASYTNEYYTGHNTPVLVTRQAPITTVSSLIAIPGGAALVEGNDDEFVIEDANAGVIRLTGTVFNDIPNGITLSYTAGWATLPADLYYSALEAVAFRLLEVEQNRVGVMSVTTVDGITQYINKPYPSHITAVWDRYKRGSAFA